MNNLSLMLYFADVAEKIASAFTLMTLIFLFASIVGTIIVVSTRIEYYGKPAPMWMVIVPILFLFLSTPGAVLIPSKNTIYLIAGSEIGEQVVKSPEAQQMFSDIREVIQQQIKELKKE